MHYFNIAYYRKIIFDFATFEIYNNIKHMIITTNLKNIF